MKFIKLIATVIVCITVGGCSSMDTQAHLTNKKVVIAHRGASGYLPEHTLESTSMAYAMSPDYIEPDVVLTKDGIPVVLHDIHLDTTTDVESRFPDRYRADGRWYAIDFTLAEIKSLNVNERRNNKTKQSVFQDRFPQNLATFKVPTLAEQIELIQGLNKSTGKDIGIYPELKDPVFHEEHGFPMAKIVLKVLADYGYTKKSDKAIVQCFDPDYLRMVKEKLNTNLTLVQLLGPNEWEISSANYDELVSREGLKKIAEYADGIGVWLHQIKDDIDNTPSYVINPNLVKDAHDAGLVVHVYTLRKDALPSYVKSLNELHELFYYDFNVDGAFTDFADETVRFLQIKNNKNS